MACGQIVLNIKNTFSATFAQAKCLAAILLIIEKNTFSIGLQQNIKSLKSFCKTDALRAKGVGFRDKNRRSNSLDSLRLDFAQAEAILK